MPMSIVACPWTAETGQAGQDNRTGQLGQDNRGKTDMTVQTGQDIWDTTIWRGPARQVGLKGHFGQERGDRTASNFEKIYFHDIRIFRENFKILFAKTTIS
jgi:hypothetical protein